MESVSAWLSNFFSHDGRQYLYAAIILLAAYLGAKLATRWLSIVLGRTRISNDALLKNFFLRLLSLAILITGVLTALKMIGWDVQTFIAGLGVTGIIIGFGLKDVLSNFAAGLLLLTYRPFRAGESIEVEGTLGIVEELTIVNMQMITNDGVRVIMPNSKVWGAKIVNYSLSQKRRLELTLKINEEQVEDGIAAIKSSLNDDSRILKSPAPSVQVASIADNSATLRVYAWTAPDQFASAGEDQYIRLQTALRRADIPIL